MVLLANHTVVLIVRLRFYCGAATTIFRSTIYLLKHYLARMQSPAGTVITCKNCGYQFTGNYCNNCGEKVYTTHDKSLMHFLEEGLHFITHFEGSFFLTLKEIFTRPGKLSTDYTNGIRKRYFKPLSFFLTLVVLYLLFPLLPGLNMQLRYHLDQFPYASLAQHWVEHFMQTHPDISGKELAEMFAAKSEKTSKLLLFIIIPLTALPLWLVVRKQRPYFFDSLIFSTEYNSFFLVTQFFVIPALLFLYALLAEIFHFKYVENEFIIAIPAISILIWFLHRGLTRFAGLKSLKLTLLILVMLAWHVVSVYIIYKFFLFVLVFLQLH